MGCHSLARCRARSGVFPGRTGRTGRGDGAAGVYEKNCREDTVSFQELSRLPYPHDRIAS